MEPESRRRSLKRKPLSDCTNTTSAKNPSLPKLPKSQIPNSDENLFTYDVIPSSKTITPNPRIRPQPFTPQQRIPSADSVQEVENAQVASVYTSRLTRSRHKDKGKEVAETLPFSCPPPEGIKSIRDEHVKEHSEVSVSKANNVENSEIRHQPSSSPGPNISDISGQEIENAGVATVYTGSLTRSRHRDKGKEVAETLPFSCPPPDRIRSTWDELSEGHSEVSVSNANNVENFEIRPRPSTPPRPDISAIPVEDNENAVFATVYSRRGTRDRSRDKGKQVVEAVPFSCPPQGRTRSIRDEHVKEHSEVSVSKANNVENSEIRHQPSSSPGPNISDISVQEIENAGVATVYTGSLTRSRHRDKGKEVAETLPFSCPPPDRIRSTWDKPSEGHSEVSVSNANNVENFEIRPRPSTPPRPDISTIPVEDNENAVFATVYSRRGTLDRTRDKGKQVVEAVPFSCPPQGRIRSISRDILREESRDVSLSRSCTNIQPKHNKKRRFSSSDVPSSLPQDFIEKQRAYFAEIDAFELPEEVATDSE